MGDDPDAAEYVNPSNEDVWQFVKRIGEWINNPARAGVRQTKGRSRLQETPNPERNSVIGDDAQGRLL